MPAFDTLSATDALFIYGDSDRAPMAMGNLCLFEGEALFDERGTFRLDDVRRAIESRLHLVPRYRRKLLEVPGGFAHPILVDDPAFDIAQHVKLVALPKPGNDEQLKESYARLHEGMLNHARPLWEITFIEGLEDGRVGMVQKIHHAPFDGASTVDIMDSLFDGTPEYVETEPPPWTPEPAPDPVTLMNVRWAEQVSSAWNWAQEQERLTKDDPERVQEIAAAMRSLEEITKAPKTSLNVPVGPRRRYDWVPTTLAVAKRIRGLVAGCTVNDVMLTVVAGGLRELLKSRGEDVDDLVLQVMVPVSLRSTSGASDAGNQVSAFVAPLPVHEGDAVERLGSIHRSTTELKEGKQALGIQLVTQSTQYTPASLMAAGPMSNDQSSGINLTVTNVPGPRRELFLLGARMLELNPQVLIGNDITLNVAVESYVDKLSIGLCADAQANPDLHVLRDAIARELDELRARAGN